MIHNSRSQLSQPQSFYCSDSAGDPSDLEEQPRSWGDRRLLSLDRDALDDD